jgi:hypothetical protein
MRFRTKPEAQHTKAAAIKILPVNEKLPRFYHLSCNRIPTNKNNRLTQHENMLRHNGHPVFVEM